MSRLQEIAITEFKGSLPKFGDYVPEGYAGYNNNSDGDADHTNMSDGNISWFDDWGDPAGSALNGSGNFTAKGYGYSKAQNQTMVMGGYFGCEWRIDSDELFIFLNGTPVARKRVGSFTAGAEANLGQVRLTNAPTTADNAVGTMDAGTYQYFVTTLRSVNGHLDESGPSAVSTALTIAANREIRITRPTITDSDVTHWKIYRISDSSGEYQFVAQVLKATTTYDDNDTDDDLSGSCPSWYTSAYGTSIIWDEFPFTTGDFQVSDGIYNGMLFAWKETTLNWCDPGFPDAWPENYSMNFPGKILYATPHFDTLIVLTTGGLFRVDGGDPESLQMNRVPGDFLPVYLGSGTYCIPAKSEKGIVYLSHEGLILATGDSQVNLLEDIINSTDTGELGQYFQPQGYDALYIVNDVIFFCSSGNSGKPVATDNTLYVTCCDMRSNPPNIYTHTQGTQIRYSKGTAYEQGLFEIGCVAWDSGSASYKEVSGYNTPWYGLTAGDIRGTAKAFTWYSGFLPYNISGRKNFKEVEIWSSRYTNNDLTLTIYVDGVEACSKVLTDVVSDIAAAGLTISYTKRSITLKIPQDSQHGDNLQFKLEGEDHFVYKAVVRYEMAEV
jgi:hypothetical protein